MRKPRILSFLSSVATVAAGPCWRDTPCARPIPTDGSFSGPWNQFIYSPVFRTVYPTKILHDDHSLLSKYSTTVQLSDGELLIYDFGQETGGIVTVGYQTAGSGTLGLAFSESRNFTGVASDGSNGSFHPGGDRAIVVEITTTDNGTYTVPDADLRGGFRYLPVFANLTSINITSVSLEISFQPTWTDLRAYGGYFYSDDELLNQIWYAGAYTLQTNAVPPNTGRVFLCCSEDGGRMLSWAPMGLQSSSMGASEIERHGQETWRLLCPLQYDLQQPSGELPMAGLPLNFYGSDTYHLSTIIGTYEFVLYSGDLAFLPLNWAKITQAISFIAAKVDDIGLLLVTDTADWGRQFEGGHNTAANAMAYRSFITGAVMESWLNETTSGVSWVQTAETLKMALSTLNWDSSVGAFRDSLEHPELFAQDSNSLALLYNLTSPSQSQRVSSYLTNKWTPIGPLCPELPNTISPYTSSLELSAHFVARQPLHGLNLTRNLWGWYLNNPYGTQSTFPEGYHPDGSWGYRADPSAGYEGDYSYMSHAHGLSTGPTYALSTYVLGLKMRAPGGMEWEISPQFGDLKSMQGGFVAGLGKFRVQRKLDSESGYSLSYEAPVGTVGVLDLATKARVPSVTADGVVVEGGVYDEELGR